ncbi:MAG: porin family protein [Acidobacteriota bacterium]|nr:porin family protein [Acidobacteriota bacterium]
MTFYSRVSSPSKFHRFPLPAALALAVLLAVFAPPASAQLADRQWELGFGVGSANIESSSEEFDLDFRSELRGALMVSPHVQVEAQLMRADALLDATLSAALGNVVINFQPENRVSPYALVGLGYSELEDINFLGLGPDRDEDGLAYQAGFGSRFFVGDEGRMAIRVELSSLWLNDIPFDQDRFTSLTAGLTWSFGQR